MPPKRITVEEEFDDDTDLPLPTRRLPHTGTRGALIEGIDSDDDEDELDIPQEPTFQQRFPPASATASASSLRPPGAKSNIQFTQSNAAFKKWTQLYPIYIDAKQPYKTGARRVQWEKSVWWPLSMEMAAAASVLGFKVAHEPAAFHPRDWQNPGRIRVAWKIDGKLQNKQFPTKKLLLERIAAVLQQQRPELTPRKAPAPAEDEGEQLPQASSSKTKQRPKKSRKRPTPQPPEPLPPLSERISNISPSLPGDILVEAVKAGMDAMKQQQVEAQQTAGAAGVGKGKRKVVRVRG